MDVGGWRVVLGLAMGLPEEEEEVSRVLRFMSMRELKAAVVVAVVVVLLSGHSCTKRRVSHPGIIN